MINTLSPIPCQYGEVFLETEVTGPQDEEFLTIVDLTVQAVEEALADAIDDNLAPVCDHQSRLDKPRMVSQYAKSAKVDGNQFRFRLVLHCSHSTLGTVLAGTLVSLLEEHVVPQANKQLLGFATDIPSETFKHSRFDLIASEAEDGEMEEM